MAAGSSFTTVKAGQSAVVYVRDNPTKHFRGKVTREAAHKLGGIVAAFSTIAATMASELEKLAVAGRCEEYKLIAAKLEGTAHKLVRELDSVSISTLQKRVSASLSGVHRNFSK